MTDKQPFTLLPSTSKSILAAVFVLLLFASCSKKSDFISPIIPVIPIIPNVPTGEIQSFTIDDTLVAFNKGTSVRWLVTGTNLNTVVTYNGVKVANSGVFDTGPLKQATTITLAVNNGKTASVSVKVADSITSLLWNGGKHLYQTKAEYLMVPPVVKDSSYVDSALTDTQKYQIFYFNLNKSSTIFQTVPFIPPMDAGLITINNTKTGFTWRGVEYTILVLDSKVLRVTFYTTQANGDKVLTRFTYSFG